MPVKAIPSGYHTVTPYLIVNNADAVVAFLKEAFGAKVLRVTNGPMGADGNTTIGNAEIRVGTSMIMVAEARDGMTAQPMMLYLYFENADAVHAQALKAGGTEMMPIEDMFYGDRHGGVIDPSGNMWFIASHVEDVSDAELQRRADAFHAERQAT
ncbi:MAG: VOC family protein [Kordiimonadaceae bacterium]|nr:VOC family protein [Kordiimonadaceae bacterium]